MAKHFTNLHHPSPLANLGEQDRNCENEGQMINQKPQNEGRPSKSRQDMAGSLMTIAPSNGNIVLSDNYVSNMLMKT